MRLVLMRHGHSPSVVEAGVKHDYERPLSDAGRAAARRQAGRLAAKGYAPDVILHSPLLRAAQTAAEVRRAFGDKPRLEAWEPLENQLPGAELARRLAERPRAGLPMLVGHMPQLGELAAVLLGTPMGLEPAAALVLEAEPPARGRLLAAFSPSEDA